MSYNKHLVFFTPAFPAHEEDTIITPPIYLLAERLLEKYPHYSISIVSLHLPQKPQSYTFRDIQVTAIGAGGCRYPKRFWYWFKAYQKLSELHREKPINLIHTFWLSECTLLAHRFAEKNNIPHLTTLMGQDVLPSNRFLRFFKKTDLPKVAIAKEQVAYLSSAGVPLPEFFIPWGFDDRNDQNANTQRRIDLIAVGSFIPLKNMHLIPDWVQQWEKKTGKQCLVELIGDGPLKSQTQEKVKSLGLKSEIIFSGAIPREEVLQKLAESKVLLHLSDFEGCSMTILEALAKGCKVIAKPVGHAKDFEFRFLKKVRDVNEIPQAINDFLMETTVEPFIPLDFSDIAQRYQLVYEEIWGRYSFSSKKP